MPDVRDAAVETGRTIWLAGLGLAGAAYQAATETFDALVARGRREEPKTRAAAQRVVRQVRTRATGLANDASRLSKRKLGQALDALGLGPVAAQLLVDEDRVEPRDAAFERDRAVGVPEELRVAQPRRQHALRVSADELRLFDFDIGHGQEGRLQPAVIVHHREVVLVVDHRRRQHFLGQRQELRGKHTGDHRRPLHQIGYLIEQS
jgi:hypothetical protein